MNLDKFVLKTWISRKVSYFVGILSRVRNIFLLGCPQIFFLLNIRFRGIFESQVQSKKRNPLINNVDIYTHLNLGWSGVSKTCPYPVTCSELVKSMRNGAGHGKLGGDIFAILIIKIAPSIFSFHGNVNTHLFSKEYFHKCENWDYLEMLMNSFRTSRNLKRLLIPKFRAYFLIRTWFNYIHYCSFSHLLLWSHSNLLVTSNLHKWKFF